MTNGQGVALRKRGQPGSGEIPRWRCDPTATGFVREFEERWHQDDKNWYSREMARADVRDGSISVLSVFCTGDWDENRHEEPRRAVQLLRL